ncbi:MAG: glycosyltransferase [Planctomycetota bacterium]
MTLAHATAWGLAGFWWLYALRGVRDVLAVPELPPLSPTEAELTAARPVSVVIAARDEAARLEGTVRRLLAQQDVDVEVIVVDDRSTDDTGVIGERLAREDPRVRCVRVATLPGDWLGKPHACQRGAELARHPWVLFTDADTWMEEDVLARALAAAEREHAQHVTLAPGIRDVTWLGEAVMCGFKLNLLPLMASANRDGKLGAIGVGAFNLIQRDTWHAIGGHTRLAMEVVDDLRLGTLLRRGGFRTRAYVAERDVVVEWAHDVTGIVRAIEKNTFANLRYSVAIASAVVIGTLALFGGALTGPVWASGLSGWAAFIGLFAMAIPAAMLARRTGTPMSPAVASPISAPVLAWAVANSTWKTLRRGGVIWRGTLFPLQRLRERRVR